MMACAPLFHLPENRALSTKSTIDPAEAAYFDRLAHTWWDPEGPFWPLHRLNQLRVGYISEHLIARFGHDPNATAPLHGIRILDIGCGGGLLSEAMARLGAAVHGVDMVGKNIRIAKRHAEASGLTIRYTCGTAEDLAERGESYDAVLNLEVVEHVADLPLFMSVCSRLVRPGGLTVIGTINRTVVSFLAAIVGAEYLLRWLPVGTHRWRKFPTPGELEALLRDGGMRVSGRTGVKVNPFARRFRLSSDMSINYMLVAEKPG
jgi:2-polyprenyl-6-hydroxyphenyl methylase/3-demethylubiquinone-9 3-methyltransferase